MDLAREVLLCRRPRQSQLCAVLLGHPTSNQINCASMHPTSSTSIPHAPTSNESTGPKATAVAAFDVGDLAERIKEAVLHAVHLLPSQGPITSFVHHNTLHAYEHLPFEQAVLEGARQYNCQPYWPLSRYREELERGRIRNEDLRAVLMDDLGDVADAAIGSLGTRYSLRLAILQHPIAPVPIAEVPWLLEQTEVLRQFHPQVVSAHVHQMVEQTRTWLLRDEGVRRRYQEARVLPMTVASFDQLPSSRWQQITLACLWQVCRDGMAKAARPQSVEVEPTRPRDQALRDWNIDTDLQVHEVLIRFCSAILDQGFSTWSLPEREQGFYSAFLQLYSTRCSPVADWMRGVRELVQQRRQQSMSAIDSIIASLSELNISIERMEAFLTSSLLALRGFAGMLWQMESAAPWAPQPLPQGTLVGFLAVRLMLDTVAYEHARQEHGIERNSERRSEQRRREKLRPRVGLQRGELSEAELSARALVIFQLAQFRGWHPQQLEQMDEEQWNELSMEVQQFDSVQQRRILHLAYERHYQQQALDGILAHLDHQRLSSQATGRPDYQVVCCIDDREESFRRHLEELDPACETFGAPGFYAVAMYYQGASHAHYRPLCPAIVTPKHYVREEPVFSAVEIDKRRSVRRRWLGSVTRSVHTGSRTLLGGFVTGVLGSLATFPLIARILAPGVTAKLRDSLGGFIRPPATELHIERIAEQPGPSDEALGYRLEEMASIVIRILQDTGLVKQLSPLVVIYGHGSSSLNNPHESAYCCGACSGGRGGPNARSFALMANDARVRQLVGEQGVVIPDDVWFVGAYHNTCNDRVEYFDLDRVPRGHRELFRRVEQAVDRARARNAHERARRFQSIPLGLSVEEALERVEERAEDLSEARPEYNHATNALCLVGRRQWSRGLFLDRRAFLQSYDPTIDDEHATILTRILQAAIPVCAGISLEYLFSTIDSEGYGCGSKLPHNIVSLLGVMTGAASDLRPGLSAQMVEIHEPMRILFVIETTAEKMRRIMQANPVIDRLVRGYWVRLAIIDPQSNHIEFFHKDRFEPHVIQSSELATTASSAEWYENWRDHLALASIAVMPMGATVAVGEQQ